MQVLVSYFSNNGRLWEVGSCIECYEMLSSVIHVDGICVATLGTFYKCIFHVQTTGTDDLYVCA